MINKVGIIILTLNAEKRISQILHKIDFKKYDVLIVDSSSVDFTVSIAKSFGCKIVIIPQQNFNHGATRENARRLLKNRVVVFLTDDAVPLNSTTIEKLIEPILKGKAVVSYARQIPMENADIFESFPREYNYGNEFQLRSLKDIKQYGVYTFFASNSCAAWSNEALDSIGGFKSTLTNEDYFACAELLNKCYKVAYVPTAVVSHSHNYSLKEEFQRMYDTGYVRAERPWIQKLVGSANKRGSMYFQQFIIKLWFNSPLLIPYAIIQTITKFIGYKLGFASLKFPKYLKKLFSGQKYYWDSKFYKGTT